jgi:hypothetical protein
MIQEGRKVILPHRVHRDERELQLVAPSRHRLNIFAESFDAARKVVEVPLNLEQRDVLERHL